jgi:hypothetical protein
MFAAAADPDRSGDALVEAAGSQLPIGRAGGDARLRTGTGDPPVGVAQEADAPSLGIGGLAHELAAVVDVGHGGPVEAGWLVDGGDPPAWLAHEPCTVPGGGGSPSPMVKPGS